MPYGNYEFTIMLHHDGKFLIRPGTGRDYIAKDINEVATAVKHWSGRDYNETHAGTNPECPLCRVRLSQT